MSNIEKKDIPVYLILFVFLGIGIWLTFFTYSSSIYDKQINAYYIEVNSEYDSDDGTMYYPTYYYKVDGNDYTCNSRTRSSSIDEADTDKKLVYFSSSNPNKCLTEFDKSTSKIMGILFMVIPSIILLLLIKGLFNKDTEVEDIEPINYEVPEVNENTLKVVETVKKITLISKRIMLGIIIFILFISIYVNSYLFKQTIECKDFEITTGVLKETIDNTLNEDEFFDYTYIYSYEVNGVSYDATTNLDFGESMLVKYNKDNPNDYCTEGSYLKTNELIIYIVKVVVLGLLIYLFFNEKLLDKFNISIGTKR